MFLTSANFLDTTVVVATARLLVKPFRKPTSVALPLSTTSAHDPCVHVSWPPNMVMRLRRLSSTREIAEHAKSELIRWFKASGAPRCLIAYLQQIDPWLSESRSYKAINRLYLPLPFHPVWAKHMKWAITSSNQNDDLQYLYQMSFRKEMPQIAPSWRNKLDPLWRLLGW